ncbi:hypothetical protein [Streptomyces sp. 5-10]|uniref:hypothetical protein n=1 Tax=Streptomyces sp. 5-10 TaxID=878925 RepID=UPI00168B4632|nr:hypothetical protein [Streptomyces sp. 5-10]MBD3004679.1 hypothetical protein [Streptomyces sp. 5-10]
MTSKETDYTPGDEPVPVGTVVDYANREGPQWIAGHDDPENRLKKWPPPPPGFNLEEAYPDGVAYRLLPVGMPDKMGNRHYATAWVRRTSFRIVEKRGNS